jgi:hypothetical protein
MPLGKALAGAPGIEPGITGSKPVALPLGYAPASTRQEHIGTDYPVATPDLGIFGVSGV